MGIFRSALDKPRFRWTYRCDRCGEQADYGVELREDMLAHTTAVDGYPTRCRGTLVLVRKEARCKGCPHPAHLGQCNARNGSTAYRCGCILDTPTSADQ